MPKELGELQAWDDFIAILKEKNLLNGELEERCREAIIQFGFSLRTLARAFVILNNAELFAINRCSDGIDQNEYIRNHVISAGANAEKLARGFVILNQSNLLRGDDNKPIRMALIQAEGEAENLAYEFARLNQVRQFRKIDERGNYTYYPGVTTVASIREQDIEFWKMIHNCINSIPEITKYYSLLPVESYHMTTFNMYVQNSLPYSSDLAWQRFISEKEVGEFKLLNDFFAQIENIQIKITGIDLTQAIIYILVDFPDAQKEQIRQIAIAAGVGAEKIPIPFHITLGYLYRPLYAKSLPEGAGYEAKHKLFRDQIIGEFTKLGIINETMRLNKPTLCYFNDMTSFIPYEMWKRERASVNGLTQYMPYEEWRRIKALADEQAILDKLRIIAALDENDVVRIGQLTRRDVLGRTLLHVAVINGYKTVAEMLIALDNEALDRKDTANKTALAVAEELALNGSEVHKIITALLTTKAEIAKKQKLIQDPLTASDPKPAKAIVTAEIGHSSPQALAAWGTTGVCDVVAGSDSSNPLAVAIPTLAPRVSTSRKDSLPASSSGTYCTSVISFIDENAYKIDRTRRLGAGGLGIVYVGYYHSQEVAIKEPLAEVSEITKREIEDEAAIMRELLHPNIVQFYGVGMRGHAILMEYMPGRSLFHLLQNGQPIGWDILLQIAKDISSGLSYLHSKQIIHQNIKSPNILLGRDLRAKLSSFKFAILKQSSDLLSSESSGCTPAWTAPEVLCGDAPASFDSDMYSLGMVFWELVTKKIPFEDVKHYDLLSQLKEGKKETIPSEAPRSFAGLITRCWAQVGQRPTARMVAEELAQLTVQQLR